MARERFGRNVREREFVSDLIATVSAHLLLPFSEKHYLLDKINEIFRRDGFIDEPAYDRINGYLLGLGDQSELSTNEFVECFDEILRSYSREKRRSLLPRVVMFRAAEPLQQEELPSHDENSLRPSGVD